MYAKQEYYNKAMAEEYYQKALATQISLLDFLDLSPFCNLPPKYIGGIDVSYSIAGRDTMSFAGLVVMEYGTWHIVEKVSAKKEISFPYIPGLLSFRELPVIMDAWQKLSLLPDIWLVDGAGVAHPRRMGLAAHFGILSGEPTIGVAKSRLIGTHVDVPIEKGCRVSLEEHGEIVGAVLRSRRNVRPLYISPGNHVSIEQAPEIVLACCTKYRLPEPTRAAHNYVTESRRDFLQLDQ